MYCKKCGAQLDPHAKFCFGCGTQVGEAAPAAAPTPTPRYEAPVPPKKAPKKKKGLLAIVAIIAVVVVAAAALIFSGVLGGNTVKVAAALAKSGKAFTDAVDKMELTDVSALVESEKFSEEISMWVDEIDGDSSLSGLGYRLSLDSDMPGRKIDMVMTPFWGSTDLLNVQMRMNNAEIYVGSPELTGGEFYMVNTETFLEDLDSMGADLDELADISFNIFDIAEQIKNMSAVNEEWTKSIKEAGTALLKEVEVDKTGSETLEVNDNDLKCTVYNVMIPEDAMHTFVNAIEDAYSDIDNTSAYIDLLESMGFPDYVVDEMEDAMDDSTYSVDMGFDVVHDALDMLGDLELNLYINGGYVVAVVYEDNIDGTEVEVVLNIGGGTNYVDDISLQILIEEEGIRVVSTGNHTGKDNVFTDETVVKYVYDGDTTVIMELETSYAPKQTEDNFSFSMEADTASVELRGNLVCDKNSMNLYLDKIGVYDYGETLAVLGMEFSIGKYQGEAFAIDDYQAFADMSEGDLMDIVDDVTRYATKWALNLDSDIQELIMDIAYDLF